MEKSQAIGYLESVSGINPKDMSKAMFRFVRSAARCAQSVYPGMAGYYDPEIECVRAEPWKYNFRRATYTQTVPQSAALLGKTSRRCPDPCASILHLLDL